MRKLIVYLVTCKRWQGKLMHRTEPFDNTDFERVLASFNFCTASSLHCNHLADLVHQELLVVQNLDHSRLKLLPYFVVALVPTNFHFLDWAPLLQA